MKLCQTTINKFIWKLINTNIHITIIKEIFSMNKHTQPFIMNVWMEWVLASLYSNINKQLITVFEYTLTLVQE